MPGPYPREFREDVVAVARRRESGVTIEQIATENEVLRKAAAYLSQANLKLGGSPK